MPGQIIQGIRRAETNDPVFMLDEIDKVGRDFRGDPTSALLEALDPEQNNTFRDNYLDVQFDLSKVLFITTANRSTRFPIRCATAWRSSSCMATRKKTSSHHLPVPDQAADGGERHYRSADRVHATTRWAFIIRHYTREAGVRSLERQIGTICRKQARRIAEGKLDKLVSRAKWCMRCWAASRFGLIPRSPSGRSGRGGGGLAWTPTGGDILFVEAMKMKGKGEFKITGQIQDVMRESMQAALSWVRSNAESCGIDEDFFTKNDLHIHVPAGAIPKDGPSAGVTIATALVSLLTERPVRPMWR